MTIEQLTSLTDDELAMCLFIVNVFDPVSFPKMEITRSHMLSYKHDMLVHTLIKAFPRIKPEAYPIFVSLMKKLGVAGEIRMQQPEPIPAPVALPETTGSI